MGGLGSSFIDGIGKAFVKAIVAKTVRDALGDAFQAGSDAMELAEDTSLGLQQGTANGMQAVANAGIGVRNQAAAGYDCTIGAVPGNFRMGQMPPTNFSEGAFTEEDPISRSASLGAFDVAITAGSFALPGKVPLNFPAGTGRVMAALPGGATLGAEIVGAGGLTVGIPIAAVAGGTLAGQMLSATIGPESAGSGGIDPANAFQVASQGGKHAGFLNQRLGKSAQDLAAEAKTLRQRAAEHMDKIDKRIGFSMISDNPIFQAKSEAGRIKHLRKEIQNFTEQAEIAEELARRAAGCQP